MQRIGVLLSVAGLLVCAAFAASASGLHRATRTCAPAHPNVAVANTQAVVYSAKERYFGAESHHPLGTFPVYRGCVYGHARSFDLGVAPPSGCSATGCGPSIDHLTLAGSVVAFERSSTTEAHDYETEGGGGEFFVIVRDLRSGRVLHAVTTGINSFPKAQFIGAGPTTTIVAKSDGSVAWTVHTRAGFEVHAVDRSGSRLLASGLDVDPNSLALAASTLYWSQGGKPVSAELD